MIRRTFWHYENPIRGKVIEISPTPSHPSSVSMHVKPNSETVIAWAKFCPRAAPPFEDSH